MALYCSKKLPALLRGITPKHYDDLCCFNCLYTFRTRNKLELHKNVSEKKTTNFVIWRQKNIRV